MKVAADSWVSLLAAAVIIDTVFLVLNYHRVVFVSKRLTDWYVRLGPSAMAMDILIIFIVTSLGVHLGRTIVDDDDAHLLPAAACCVLGLQIVHDLVFAALFNVVPRGASFILDVFKDYGKEVRFAAVWSDSLMVLGTFFLAEGLCHLSSMAQGLVLASSLYVGLFALYIKQPVAYT